MSSILSVKNLKTAYKTRLGQYVYAVDDVSFELEEGKALGIAGESGCGKSTLALSLMGYYFPPLTYLSGEINVNDRDIMSLSYDELRTSVFGKELSYIPQSAMNVLNPTLRVIKFIQDVFKEHEPKATREEVYNRTKERFEILGLPERAIRAYPNELSGGMKQRVVIAVSTLLNPKILIADELTSALDVSSQKLVMKMIKQMLEMKIVSSIIYITHELPLLRHIADEIMIMYAGQIVERGLTDQVIFDPIHPYTKALMGSIIVPEKGAKEWEIVGIPGAPPDLKKKIDGCRFAERCKYRSTICKQHLGLENYDKKTNRYYLCDIDADQLREVYESEKH